MRALVAPLMSGYQHTSLCGARHERGGDFLLPGIQVVGNVHVTASFEKIMMTMMKMMMTVMMTGTYSSYNMFVMVIMIR